LATPFPEPHPKSVVPAEAHTLTIAGQNPGNGSSSRDNAIFSFFVPNLLIGRDLLVAKAGFFAVYVGLTTPVRFAAWPPDLRLLPRQFLRFGRYAQLANFPLVAEKLIARQRSLCPGFRRPSTFFPRIFGGAGRLDRPA
jgi:hypothetical protein